MHRRLAWTFASLTLLAIGCGDASVLGTANGEGGDDVVVSRGGSDGSGGDTGSATVGSGAGTTTSSSSSSSGTGGSAGVGGMGQGGEPPMATLECGNQLCPVAGDNACCFDRYQIYGQPQAECVMGPVASDGCTTSMPGENGPGGFETRIECQVPEHCPGQICCGQREAFQQMGQTYGYYESVTCVNECSYPNIVLCATPGLEMGCPMLPSQNGPVQSVCQQSSLLPTGYYVCGYPG